MSKKRPFYLRMVEMVDGTDEAAEFVLLVLVEVVVLTAADLGAAGNS